MGEKDPVAPGASRGETPRLRILDQTLRQSGNKKKKKKNQLSVHSVDIVRFEWQSSALCKLLVFIGGRY
jgi:hypothetical protein